MNQGGLVLLDVVPKVSAAGKVISKGFGDAVNKERNLQMKRSKSNDGTIIGSEKATSLDMRAYRFEYSINELLGYLGEVDVPHWTRFERRARRVCTCTNSDIVKHR